MVPSAQVLRVTDEHPASQDGEALWKLVSEQLAAAAPLLAQLTSPTRKDAPDA